MGFSADTWIALVALVVAFASAVYTGATSRRLTRLQVQLADGELKDRREAEEWARRADLRVWLDDHPDRFVVKNEGGAVAQDVRVEIRSHAGARNPGGGRDPIEVAGRRLPLARLDPEDECELSAAVFREYEAAFDVVVRWRDPDGSERVHEKTVYT